MNLVITAALISACENHPAEVNWSEMEPSFEASGEVTISDLQVASEREHRVQDGGLKVGALQYTDRSYTFATIPEELQGLTYIQTANDDKISHGDDSFISFTVDRDVTIYIAHDDRVERPEWLLKGFLDTGLKVVNDERVRRVTYSVFKRNFAPGTVTLGSNAPERQGSCMYTVIIQPASAPPTVTNLQVASRKEYAVVNQGLYVGAVQYTDRTYTFATVPNELQGLTYIRTANDDKISHGDDSFLSFTVDTDVAVYVAHDDRVERPEWLLTGFTDTGLKVVNDEGVRQGPYSVFKRNFAAGTVTLGSNAPERQESSMYTVIVEHAPAPPPSDPPPPPSGGPVVVFPGAEGFGVQTRAAYGGSTAPQVIRVTNLNASGSGSLQAALAASGPRVVIFEVSGTIWTTSNLDIRNPYVTIAGQTAPSPGITIAGAGIRVRTHDVLIQHLRVRPGDDPNGPNPDGRDAIIVMDDAYNVVIDHNSFSWGIDENASASSGRVVKDITFSNNIISEGLSNSLHSKGEHSKGLLVFDRAQNVSMLGNLFAHNMSRSPMLNAGTRSLILNNLVYNPGRDAVTYSADLKGAGPLYSSVVGNVIIPGPSSASNLARIRISPSIAEGTEIYLADNRAPHLPSDPWDIVTWWPNSMSFSPRVKQAPVWISSLTVHPSSGVEARVLAAAGARPADRDAVDARVINEVKTRTGRIIDSPRDVGGYPNLPQNKRSLSLPSSPHALHSGGSGYTNLEVWLHEHARTVEGR